MDTLEFILLDVSAPLIKEWQIALTEHIPESFRKNFTIVQSKLQELKPPNNQFDCIVSPANSYGRLDGGFDQFLSETLSPDDVVAPTKLAQATLYQHWKGYAPPGTCTLVPLKGSVCAHNQHGCSFIALCPTMRTPENVVWNREVVYNCMWSLLVSLDKHNQAATTTDESRIHRVLMSGLGTCTGGISAKQCAQQMALAVRDFIDASENPEKWSSMDWDDALHLSRDCRQTHSSR